MHKGHRPLVFSHAECIRGKSGPPGIFADRLGECEICGMMYWPKLSVSLHLSLPPSPSLSLPLPPSPSLSLPLPPSPSLSLPPSLSLLCFAPGMRSGQTPPPALQALSLSLSLSLALLSPPLSLSHELKPQTLEKKNNPKPSTPSLQTYYKQLLRDTPNSQPPSEKITVPMGFQVGTRTLPPKLAMHCVGLFSFRFWKYEFRYSNRGRI